MVAGKMIQTDVEESDKAMFKHAGQWFASKDCDNSVWCCNSIKNIVFWIPLKVMFFEVTKDR